MTVLTFSAPQNFSDSFQVPVDHSAWNGQYVQKKWYVTQLRAFNDSL